MSWILWFERSEHLIKMWKTRVVDIDERLKQKIAHSLNRPNAPICVGIKYLLTACWTVHKFAWVSKDTLLIDETVFIRSNNGSRKEKCGAMWCKRGIAIVLLVHEMNSSLFCSSSPAFHIQTRKNTVGLHSNGRPGVFVTAKGGTVEPCHWSISNSQSQSSTAEHLPGKTFHIESSCERERRRSNQPTVRQGQRPFPLTRHYMESIARGEYFW